MATEQGDYPYGLRGADGSDGASTLDDPALPPGPSIPSAEEHELIKELIRLCFALIAELLKTPEGRARLLVLLGANFAFIGSPAAAVAWVIFTWTRSDDEIRDIVNRYEVTRRLSAAIERIATLLGYGGPDSSRPEIIEAQAASISIAAESDASLERAHRSGIVVVPNLDEPTLTRLRHASWLTANVIDFDRICEVTQDPSLRGMMLSADYRPDTTTLVITTRHLRELLVSWEVVTEAYDDSHVPAVVLDPAVMAAIAQDPAVRGRGLARLRAAIRSA